MRGKKTTWVIVGSMHTPIGGVTIFTKRFFNQRLRRGSKIYNCNPRNIRGLLGLIKYTFLRPEYIIINTMRWQMLLMIILLFPVSKRIVVDHNHSRVLLKQQELTALSSKLKFFISIKLLNRFDRIWIVSNHLRENYNQLNLSIKLKLINPFIKPDPEEYNNALDMYSKELLDLLNEKNRKSCVFVINAYELVSHNGKDLYGVDMALKAFHKFLTDQPSAKLILFVSKPKPTEFYKNAWRLIDELKLLDNIIWEEGEKPLWPVFTKVDAFLRPTQTDGWSVSISEALAFNCKVIATNVVPRAANVSLFSLDDLSGLYEEMRKITPREYEYKI